MKLSSYIVRHDSGFSPNPFGRVCTLACCKPAIRRNAEPGDIVVGTGSANHGLSGHLIYAMRVGRALSFEEYWARYPSKRPSSATHVKRRGDNIWYLDASKEWRAVSGAFHDEQGRDRDLGGRNVLVSTDFYYFGCDAIRIPDEFHGLIATTQGHKNTDDMEQINKFWNWIETHAPKPGRIGVPLEFLECAVCECSPTSKREC